MMRFCGPLLIATSVLLAVIPLSSHAQEPPALRYNLAADIGITAVGAVTWATSEVFRSSLTPQCRWCDRTTTGVDNLNGVDRFFRSALLWKTPSTANTLSNVTTLALAPLAAFGLTGLANWQDRRSGNFAVDALLIGEAAVIAGNLTQIVKFSAARERPYAHAMSATERSVSASRHDHNVSFYSGHTSLAFSLAVSSGTIASMRGYAVAPLIWGVGLTVSAATAYLRVAADQHYFTDVLVGAVMGSAVGFLVPWIFHQPHSGTSTQLAVAPTDGGGALMYTFPL